MNNFLAMLDKLAQKPALTDASVRVFKLETNSVSGETLPAPTRLGLDSPNQPQAGQSTPTRQRRPKS
jgi:hypothetical protein